MKKLQAIIPHMANTAVKVNGNVYQIDKDGVVAVDNEDDYNKLAANSGGYRPFVARKPVAVPKTPAKPEKTAEKPPEEPQSEPEPEIEPEIESETEKEETDEDEYPDPSMAMSLAELQKLADVYQVAYTKKTTKRELVETINAAMYGE